jgi:hypothetical protein
MHVATIILTYNRFSAMVPVLLIKVTHACRWDESDISLLPEYLKKFFVKVISNFREFEDELESHEKYRNVYNIKGVMSPPSS